MLKNIQNAKEFNPFLIEAVNKVTIQGIFFMYDVVFVEITPKQVATMSTIDKLSMITVCLFYTIHKQALC